MVILANADSAAGAGYLLKYQNTKCKCQLNMNLSFTYFKMSNVEYTKYKRDNNNIYI